MPNHNYYVYITTNPHKTVLYTGLTNDLRRRIIEHFNSRGNKNLFAGKYYCYYLIYFEYFTDVRHTIRREKEIKNMTREKKNQLIEKGNPKWHTIILD